MRERPIIFSGLMVKAILEGRKTQTRRVVKPNTTNIGPCPYGKPGDRLWVRETFFTYGKDVIHYRADGDPDIARVATDCGLWQPSIHMPRWASRLTLEIVSVRVQRLQEIRAEDCRAEGIEKTSLGFRDYELPANIMHGVPALYSFETLWDSINGKREGCSWADNSYVWAITFRRIEG